MQKRDTKIWLETSKVYGVCGKGPNPTEQCFSHGGHAVTFWHFHVPFRGSKSCKTALPLTESQITSTPRCALSPHIMTSLALLEKYPGVSNTTTKYSIFIHGWKKCMIWFQVMGHSSSNSSSFTFWSSQFASSSKSNWTGIWTGNSNGSWTDKQSSHFSTAKEMSVKATFFFL